MSSADQQLRLVKATAQPKRQVGGQRAAREVLVTRVGLQLPALLAFDTWEETGHRISAVADSSAWCLGDWIVYGQSRYTDRYRRAVEAVGLDYQTLRNYAWVARSFELFRRRDALSFQHHAEVAALNVEEQDYWLNMAERHKWSRNQLRKNIRGVLEDTTSESGKVPVLELKLTPDRIAFYRSAACHSDVSLESWALSQLDAAASVMLPAGQAH